MTETINVANIDKVHKNPIAELVQTACQFESHIDISSEGKNINAKSLMGIMAFGLRDGMSVTISAEGNDADNNQEVSYWRVVFLLRRMETWQTMKKRMAMYLVVL